MSLSETGRRKTTSHGCLAAWGGRGRGAAGRRPRGAAGARRDTGQPPARRHSRGAEVTRGHLRHRQAFVPKTSSSKKYKFIFIQDKRISFLFGLFWLRVGLYVGNRLVFFSQCKIPGRWQRACSSARVSRIPRPFPLLSLPPSETRFSIV